MATRIKSYSSEPPDVHTSINVPNKKCQTKSVVMIVFGATVTKLGRCAGGSFGWPLV